MPPILALVIEPFVKHLHDFNEVIPVNSTMSAVGMANLNITTDWL